MNENIKHNMNLKLGPDKTCRVCLSESDQLKSISAKTEDENDSILESLHFVVNIKISLEHLLPNQICKNCETALYSAEAFKRRCLNSEMVLTEQFNRSNRGEILEELSKTPVKVKQECHRASSLMGLPYNASNICNNSKRKSQIEVFPVISVPESDHNYLEDNIIEPLVLTTKVKLEPNSESDGFCEAPFEPSSTFICKKETIYLPQTDIDEKPIQMRKTKRLIKQSKRSGISKNEEERNETSLSEKKLISDDVKDSNCVEKTTNCDIECDAPESEIDMATPKNICPTCNREFKLASQLKNHIIKVHVRGNRKDLDYECEICKATFPQLWLLNKHMRFHSEDAFTHICPECGKKLRNKYYLEEHMMRHKGVKPFQCDQCDNSFVTKMELIMHKRRHNGEMPFSCEHCGRKFRAYSSLVRHRRTHTGERPYKCDMCPKSFAESGTRNEHRRIHTGEKPFQCKYCDQKFTKRHHLKTHLSQHGEPSKKQNK